MNQYRQTLLAVLAVAWGDIYEVKFSTNRMHTWGCP
jgi:hypothetical protein